MIDLLKIWWSNIRPPKKQSVSDSQLKFTANKTKSGRLVVRDHVRPITAEDVTSQVGKVRVWHDPQRTFDEERLHQDALSRTRLEPYIESSRMASDIDNLYPPDPLEQEIIAEVVYDTVQAIETMVESSVVYDSGTPDYSSSSDSSSSSDYSSSDSSSYDSGSSYSGD